MQPIKIHSRQIAGAATQTVNGRELHAFLGVGKDFSNWIKAQIKRADLVEGVDFMVLTQKGENPQGGRPLGEYHLTIDAGKNVAMLSGTAKGKEVRRYFIDCEARAKAAVASGANWQQMRQEGKQVRLAWGGCVQEFVAYARAQGSTHADKYYMAITKMEYCALEMVKQAADQHFRDSLDCFQHGQLTVVEMAAQRALAHGMAAGLHYKAIYQHCKECCLELARSLRKLVPANADSMRVSYVGAARAPISNSKCTKTRHCLLASNCFTWTNWSDTPSKQYSICRTAEGLPTWCC